jgi:hypothetical protein
LSPPAIKPVDFRCGRNVLYITGELSEQKIMKRIEANLLNMDNNEIAELPKEVYVARMKEVFARSPGRLIVKEYPMGSTNVLTFDALIDELKLKKGFVPDIVYVDYLGVFLSPRADKKGGMYEAGKYVSEDLHALAKRKIYRQ